MKNPYARAMMLYAATVAEKNFSLDPRKINKEYLSGQGKAELARISSEVKEELINSQWGRKFGTASPTFLFRLSVSIADWDSKLRKSSL